MSTKLKCFVSAGEHSGDLLGANLVQAFNELYPQVEFFGLTGQNMENAGVQSIAHMSEVNVMGFWEVLKNLPNILSVEKRILATIEREQPDFIILIDFPGFHFKLAEQLKLRGFKVFQYIAPKVWAWGEKRIENLRRDFALVLGIFPFEIDYFAKHQVPFKYVGCPLKDRISKVVVKKQVFGIPENHMLITCLPGSRMSEINRILPIILQIKAELENKYDNISFLIPVADNLNFQEIIKLIPDRVSEKPAIHNWGVADFWAYKSGITLVKGMSLEMMAIADAAIVASGTATLECALLKTPMVVLYSMSAITYKIAKRKVKIPWVSLVNILAQKEVVKEYVQIFEVSDVVSEVLSLLDNKDKRANMITEFEHISTELLEDAAKNASNQIMAMVLE